MNDRAVSDLNHQRFLKHLSESTKAVSVVGEWLTRKGRTVQISGIHSSDDYDERMKYTDEGDLFILQRIEVKKRSLDFTCAEDWPHGDKFIVCAKHSWDNAIVKPVRYIILNKSMTHAAMVSASTLKTWTVEKRRDSRYEGDEAVQEFYFCPISSVTFTEIN